MREHFEVINHKKAFDLVIQLSKLPWKEVFTEKNFLNIHEIILTNINDEYAGRYRNVNVRILNSNEVFPNHLKVPDLMEVFVKDFLERYEHLDVHNVETVLKYGYDLHRNFVKIHPFID
jgi:Fic family protein